jgi:hypothetical protein
MAEGSNTPNIDLMLAHRMSQAQGNGSMPVFLGLKGEVDYGRLLSPTNVALIKADGNPPTFKSPGKEGMGTRFLTALAKAAGQLSEINRSTPITLGGSIHEGTPLHSNVAQNIGAPMRGDDGISNA